MDAGRVGRVTATIEIPAESLTIVAAPPEMLSQRNVEAVLGIPRRVFLQEIRAPGFPLPVTKLGKLRLVDRAAFVAHLQSLAATAVDEHRAHRVEVDGVTAVLAQFGLEPVSPPSARGASRERRPRPRGRLSP